MDSTQVLKALAKRHTITNNDFFITEVRTGASWTAKNSYFIMDAIAIRKSWTKPCVTAYEVKVSRGDFLRDEKWPRYLDFCNEMYFACPAGIIQVEELPVEVGLVYIGETGAIRTMRKTAYRKIDIPKEFYIHVIFSHLDGDRIPFYSNKRQWFADWVVNKISNTELGNKVSTKLVYELRMAAKEIGELKAIESRYNEIEKILRDNGLLNRYYVMCLDDELKELKEKGKNGDGNGKRDKDIVNQLKGIIQKLDV